MRLRNNSEGLGAEVHLVSENPSFRARVDDMNSLESSLIRAKEQSSLFRRINQSTALIFVSFRIEIICISRTALKNISQVNR